MIKKIAFATAAASLVATPLAAEQAVAQVQRDAAPITEESELAGNTTLFFILGIAAVVAAIVLLAEDDDDPISA